MINSQLPIKCQFSKNEKTMVIPFLIIAHTYPYNLWGSSGAGV